jgi:hypothetical protein
MIHFNGGTVALGTSISPLGAYAGYLLLNSGNVWLAACFLTLTTVYFSILTTMLVRYIVNYRRRTLRGTV